jgi:NAD(P)H-dependent FMN reductase
MQSPNDNAIRILALAGSFRKGSLNQALIQTARELTPDRARIDGFDLRTVPSKSSIMW